ncbi:hypothetical protein LJK87_08455 [Paenibacillus sp. P25]|nr:hypothetical protein LJK87_08455 [Paenibacillus sp. P25]
MKAAEFVLNRLRREDGRLLARYRDGEAAYLAYADDYAFLVWGLIELFEATHEPKWLQTAVELNEEMLRLFWDEEKGGLFFYGHDGEQLFTRPKEIYDGALPSGNSAAALNLHKLARYTFNAALAQKADEQLRAFAGSVERYPSGHALFLIALDFAVSAPAEIVIAGDPARPDTQEMLYEVQRAFLPQALTILHPAKSEKAAELAALVPWVQDKSPLGGRATAYVCENYACQSPVGDVEEPRELLGTAQAGEGESD